MAEVFVREISELGAIGFKKKMKEAILAAYIEGIENGYWQQALLWISPDLTKVCLVPKTETGAVAKKDMIEVKDDGTYTEFIYRPHV